MVFRLITQIAAMELRLGETERALLRTIEIATGVTKDLTARINELERKLAGVANLIADESRDIHERHNSLRNLVMEHIGTQDAHEVEDKAV